MNIKKISILLSLFAIVLAQVFSESILAILAFILIISIGILHGANDILLIEKTKFISVKNKWFVKLIYSFIVVFAVCMFYFVPMAALLIFILFSAYHFGEQHWSSFYNSSRLSDAKKSFHFFFGLLILSLLFLLKFETTNKIIFDIANFSVPEFWFSILTISSFSGALLLAFYLVYTKEIDITKASFEFSLVVLYTVVFYSTPLILGFAIYFTFWHSLPSLKDQINFIYNKPFKKGVKLYFKDAGVYWFISVIGFGVFVYFFYETKLFYSFLFSFIAAITFPHVIVMGKMFKYLKNQKPG